MRSQVQPGISPGFTQQHSPGFVGQTLDGKYRIDAKLGSGGMGDVYSATRLLIGDVVAIKILHPRLARDPQAAERFRREAVMATKLRHRNVVGIYDVGISAAHNVPYILMELAEGYTLRQIIKQYGVLPLDFAVTVTTQVCSALDEAHHLGIIHRDIKPENIVANQTTTGWYIKVLDFGIAKLYNQGDIGLTLDGSAMGTPQYMSPEQCMGESLDARSDIYSVGIMLYEMLTGTVPFKSATPSAIAVHQVHTPPQAPRLVNDEIHPEVEGVILRSIWKQREHRQQKASELAQELIKAATVAFRSGFTAVPTAPIPAPDVVPEFEAPNVNEPVQAPEATLPDADKTVKVPTKKAKRPRKKKQIDPPPVEGISLEDSGEVPDPLPISSPDIPLVSVAKTDSSYPETIPFETAPTEILDANSIDTIPGSNGAPAEQTTGEDLSSVFEAAELRLDEILRDRPDRDASTEEVGEPKPDSTEPVKIASMSGSISIVPEPTEAETGNRRLFLALGAALVGLGVLAGIGYLVLQPRPVAGTGNEREMGLSTSGDDSTQAPSGMALVPGGEFVMGSDQGDKVSRPAHKVTIKPFYLDITEVTNDEYKKFVDATGHIPPKDWKGGTFPDGKAKFPVVNVNWDDAEAYASWTGKRLPTEEEWEFAARGTDGRLYPWGKDWKATFANAGPTKGMREVGQGDGKSPFGMFDMVGNAWEWTSNDFVPYPGGKLSETASTNLRVIRGGCFLSRPDQATVIIRVGWPTSGGTEYDNTSFRCAKDVATTTSP